MEKYLWELIITTFIIHLVDTLSYAVRLNSVRSGQFALSVSLFNVFVLLSRTANTLQGPFIGGLIGASKISGIDPVQAIRQVIFASTIGTLAGIVLIPTFLSIFAKAVEKLEVTGSVPNLVLQSLSKNNIKRIVKSTTAPTSQMLINLRYREIPKRLLLFNTLITGVYTIGVLAAFYAATLVDERFALAASASSGLINGVASILLTLFIDPTAAIITDQAYRGNRPVEDIKALVVLLIGTKVLGTLLGQILFLPAAQIIAAFYR